jgi:hypothetical protein
MPNPIEGVFAARSHTLWNFLTNLSFPRPVNYHPKRHRRDSWDSPPNSFRSARGCSMNRRFARSFAEAFTTLFAGPIAMGLVNIPHVTPDAPPVLLPVPRSDLPSASLLLSPKTTLLKVQVPANPQPHFSKSGSFSLAPRFMALPSRTCARLWTHGNTPGGMRTTRWPSLSSGFQRPLTAPPDSQWPPGSTGWRGKWATRAAGTNFSLSHNSSPSAAISRASIPTFANRFACFALPNSAR